MDSELSALTRKQEAFVLEYLKDFNGYQAAIRSGYAENSARVTASRLLTNANIQEALRAHRSQIESELRQQFVFDALLARKVLIEILNDDEASHGDKIKAAKDLLDRAGFRPTEKKEIAGAAGPIEIRFVDSD